MQTTYNGLGDLDVETRARIEHLARTYTALLGFAPHESRITTTVRTHHEHELTVFTITIKLKALGVIVARARASSTSIHDAQQRAATKLEYQLDSAVERIHYAPHTHSFAYTR